MPSINFQWYDGTRRISSPEEVLTPELIQEFILKLERAVEAALPRIAHMFEAALKLEAPRRTGRLMRSIRVSVRRADTIGIAAVFYLNPVDARTGFVQRAWDRVEATAFRLIIREFDKLV